MLLVLVILNAWWLISKRYQSRIDYAVLDELHTEAGELHKEYTRLQLEEGTYSSNLVLQDFAINKLGLIQPDKQHILEIKE
jgi:cell division protein FtsL